MTEIHKPPKVNIPHGDINYNKDSMLILFLWRLLYECDVIQLLYLIHFLCLPWLGC